MFFCSVFGLIEASSVAEFA